MKTGYLQSTNGRAWTVMAIVGVIIISWATVSIFRLA